MKRIFIMDDNEDLLEIMNHILGREYKLLLKPDTSNILESVTDFQPDVIILDHSIGDVNSADVLESLRRSDPAFSTPVILFSAHLRLPQLAEELGAYGYLEKPSSISYIRDYIGKVLSAG